MGLPGGESFLPCSFWREVLGLQSLPPGPVASPVSVCLCVRISLSFLFDPVALDQGPPNELILTYGSSKALFPNKAEFPGPVGENANESWEDRPPFTYPRARPAWLPVFVFWALIGCDV